MDTILQKTKLELDENGTKAAAVTAVTMECMSAAVENEPIIKIVELTRPFAFLIYDRSNDEILFIGKVTSISWYNQVSPLLIAFRNWNSGLTWCSLCQDQSRVQILWHSLQYRFRSRKGEGDSASHQFSRKYDNKEFLLWNKFLSFHLGSSYPVILPFIINQSR